MVSEEYIIKGLKNHDDDAYKYLFEHHYSYLCAFAEMIVKDPYTSETIVGDLFCHLWEMGGKLDIRGGIRPYLITAVKRRCLNFLEQNFVRKEVFGDLDIDIAAQDNPTGRLILRELDGRINAAIENLPEKTRQVFRLSRLDGKTYVEISNELGISVNTVKYHMKAAFSFLSAAVEDF